MSETKKIIVLVQDSGDAAHGEISVLDEWEKAERLIETLLEAGFERERIQVFRGHQNEFEISHRPVVSFGGGTARESEAPPAPTTAERTAAEPVATRPASGAEQAKAADPPAPVQSQPEPRPKPILEAERAEGPPTEALKAEDGPSGGDGEAEEEPPAEEPVGEEQAAEEREPAAPVRFSSLFRSA